MSRSKKITRTRYYCDFCEAEGRIKGFWSRPAIEKHERGCTANRDRVCGLCEHARLKQKPIAELIACISEDKPNYGVDDLRKLAEGCPGCILAGIRQSNIQKPPEGEPSRTWERPVDFDFKSELTAFWAQVNQDQLEAESHY